MRLVGLYVVQLNLLGSFMFSIPQAMPVTPTTDQELLDLAMPPNAVANMMKTKGKTLPNYEASRLLPPEAFNSPVRTRGPPASDSQDTLVFG